MKKEKNPRKNKKNIQVLAYPLPVHNAKDKISRTLILAQKWGNRYLQKIYKDEQILSCLTDGNSYAYKILEPLLEHPAYIPSRINRCILKECGRILRSMADRKELFEILKNFSLDPNKWDYQELIKQKDIYKKAFYIRNLKEQTLNFIKEKGKFPDSFFNLQKCPEIKKPILNYAPDDEQAIQIKDCGDHLELKIKVAIPSNERFLIS